VSSQVVIVPFLLVGTSWFGVWFPGIVLPAGPCSPPPADRAAGQDWPGRGGPGRHRWCRRHEGRV